MNIEFQGYKDFPSILDRYDIEMPTTISLIPVNLEDANDIEDWVFQDSVKSLKKLWLAESIVVENLIIDSSNTKYLHLHSVDWVAPTLFLSSALLLQNPNVISVALGVVANYATEIFKGRPNNTSFRMELIIEEEKKTKYKKLVIEGEPRDMDEIVKAIKELKK